MVLTIVSSCAAMEVAFDMLATCVSALIRAQFPVDSAEKTPAVASCSRHRPVRSATRLTRRRTEASRDFKRWSGVEMRIFRTSSGSKPNARPLSHASARMSRLAMGHSLSGTGAFSQGGVNRCVSRCRRPPAMIIVSPDMIGTGAFRVRSMMILVAVHGDGVSAVSGVSGASAIGTFAVL